METTGSVSLLSAARLSRRRDGLVGAHAFGPRKRGMTLVGSVYVLDVVCFPLGVDVPLDESLSVGAGSARHQLRAGVQHGVHHRAPFDDGPFWTDGGEHPLVVFPERAERLIGEFGEPSHCANRRLQDIGRKCDDGGIPAAHPDYDPDASGVIGVVSLHPAAVRGGLWKSIGFSSIFPGRTVRDEGGGPPGIAARWALLGRYEASLQHGGRVREGMHTRFVACVNEEGDFLEVAPSARVPFGASA